MQNYIKTHIKEIFTSIQGEGPYVGEKQTFVRFSKCNLNCDFCDTDFKINTAKEYSTYNLFEILKNENSSTVSFTGGEPLIDVEFLKEFLQHYKKDLNKKIYLETNGTLYNELNEIIDLIDIVSMDIKIKSATKQENDFLSNEKFLKIANKKEVFVKVVFDENIIDDEIDKIIQLVKTKNNLLILQPKMPINPDFDFGKIFNKFYLKYKNTRLIPQVHKFLNVL